jgi:methanogenic corrinoid protein MtbC1
MQEIQTQEQGRAGSKDSAGVIFFASQVVSLLAERNARTFSELREPVVSGLIAAAMSGKPDAFADLLRELKRSRVSAAALADLYIPEAARRMGEAWQDDQMSWLDVSIGVGRMQSLLRELGMAWVADQAGDTGHGTVLLIVPDREQHTLGPMVAMGQMRRFGVSVCLRIAPSHNELRSLLVSRQFDGVLISVATKDKLDSVCKTIQFIKAAAGRPTPIVVGGAVTPNVPDLAAMTGADLSSNDICAALEALGLKFDSSCVLRRA